MPTYTPNYDLAKPIVNSAVDQDLWGNETNGNWDIVDTTLKSLQDQITVLVGNRLPVGSIYINYSDSTNPATLLGYGTWTAVTDRFLIGASGTYPAGTTGGATTHTLTASEIPSITSSVGLYGSEVGGGSQYIANAISTNVTNGTCTGITSNNTGGAAHSILNPYIAVYMWRRTA